MKKTEPQHVDAIGRPLKVGDPVAVAYNKTSLLIGQITAMGEKQIRVVKYGQPSRIPKSPYGNNPSTKPAGKLRYPSEAVLLDGPNITMYLLKVQNVTK